MRALIVEDEPMMARLFRRLLEEIDFAVDTAETDASARVLAMVNTYDAIMLDLVLPDGHGIPLLQWLRREGRDTPVMVLTGNTERATLVQAFDAGADDFLTKPVESEEFAARVRALVRRGRAQHVDRLTVGDVVLDRLAREVAADGAAVRLTGREFAVLEYFMLQVGKVVSRTELLDKVFGMDFDPGTNILDVNVARLRKKLAQEIGRASWR